MVRNSTEAWFLMHNVSQHVVSDVHDNPLTLCLELSQTCWTTVAVKELMECHNLAPYRCVYLRLSVSDSVDKDDEFADFQQASVDSFSTVGGPQIKTLPTPGVSGLPAPSQPSGDNKLADLHALIQNAELYKTPVQSDEPTEQIGTILSAINSVSYLFCQLSIRSTIYSVSYLFGQLSILSAIYFHSNFFFAVIVIFLQYFSDSCWWYNYI